MKHNGLFALQVVKFWLLQCQLNASFTNDMFIWNYMWAHITFLVFRAFKNLPLSTLKSMCMPVHITIPCLTNQIAAGS